VPTVVLGEENDYYGTFLPEITDNVTHDIHRFNRDEAVPVARPRSPHGWPVQAARRS